MAVSQLLSDLGRPEDAENPEDYVSRAVRLYYSRTLPASDEESEDSPQSQQPRVYGRERHEAAKMFLEGAARLLFDEDDDLLDDDVDGGHVPDEDQREGDMKDSTMVGSDMVDGDEVDGLLQGESVELDSSKIVQTIRKPRRVTRDILEEAERIVLSGYLTDSIKLTSFNVRVEKGDIHTVCYSGSYQTPQIPLLLIHGIGGATPTFYKIYIHLARDRLVYGIDLPGFALSSRIDFPNDWESCEALIVQMLEQWRQQMGIESVILIGHSFGAYIATAYALQYHEHVHHLCLMEPWGMYPKEADTNKSRYWIAEEIFEKIRVNPVEMFRKLGDEIIGKVFLKGILSKDDRAHYGQDCLNYFVRMITNGTATGFKAFSVITNYTFKYPVITLAEKLKTLCAYASIPISIMCGEFSDLYQNGMECISEVQATNTRVVVKIFKNAGHHVQVQKPFEVAWFLLNSVLSESHLPPLDPAYLLWDMIEKGHCKPPQPLVTAAALSDNKLSTALSDLQVFIIFVVPILSFIFYIIVQFIEYVLKTASLF